MNCVSTEKNQLEKDIHNKILQYKEHVSSITY